MVTKKTHFNPCFWTAYWNKAYYEKATNGGNKDNCRDQSLFSLNIRAGKIIPTTSNNSHYEKYLGVSEITEEGAKRYVKENFPNEYIEFERTLKSEDYPLILCYENLFTKLESLPPYQVLEEVIAKRTLNSFEEKVWIASFILLQRVRGHAFINSMVEADEMLKRPKFEFMLSLRRMLMNQDFMFKVTYPVATSGWTFYVSDRHRLPLCDSPILQHGKNIMVALSPRLLLEIDLGKGARDKDLVRVKKMSKGKAGEFRARTINRTYREILFGDRELLERYQDDPLFKARKLDLEKNNAYNKILKTTGGKEIYHFGV